MNLVDIETLNRRAFAGNLELTAISVHAYAYLADKYIICSCGASMGDRYGPMVVARQPGARQDLTAKTIAIPGTLTSADLALRLCLDVDLDYVVVPFDRIITATLDGKYEGQPIDAGLIIQEGQLTYANQNLHMIVDLGQWWHDDNGASIALGGQRAAA